MKAFFGWIPGPQRCAPADRMMRFLVNNSEVSQTRYTREKHLIRSQLPIHLCAFLRPARGTLACKTSQGASSCRAICASSLLHEAGAGNRETGVRAQTAYGHCMQHAGSGQRICVPATIRSQIRTIGHAGINHSHQCLCDDGVPPNRGQMSWYIRARFRVLISTLRSDRVPQEPR